jgi:hypothetical protein
LQGCKNVVEQKSTKGVSPTGFLRNPKRRTGAEHIPFVKRWFLLQVAFCLYIIFCVIAHVVDYKTAVVLHGDLSKLKTAKKGSSYKKVSGDTIERRITSNQYQAGRLYKTARKKTTTPFLNYSYHLRQRRIALIHNNFIPRRKAHPILFT